MNEKQRVNLQYSIELQNLPREVLRLVEKSNEILKSTADDGLDKLLELPLNEVLSLRAIQCIENERQKYQAADHVLDDVVNIINSYVSYKVQENAEKLQETSVENTNTETQQAPEIVDGPPSSQSTRLPPPPKMPTLDPSSFLPEDLSKKLEEFREAMEREKPTQASK